MTTLTYIAIAIAAWFGCAIFYTLHTVIGNFLHFTRNTQLKRARFCTGD